MARTRWTRTLSAYDEKLQAFIEATSSFDHEASLSGLENNGVFNEIRARFTDVLIERESISGLESGKEKLVGKQSGFSIAISESHRINGTTFRMIELKNEHTEKTNGAFDSLLIQYWTDSNISYEPLVESRTTSAESTSMIDYRFLKDLGVVSVIQKEYRDVFNIEDSYILFLFSLKDGLVESIVPDAINDFNNGYWGVAGREFSFDGPNRTLWGFRISELSEEDNAGRTSLEISGAHLDVYNTEKPESRIGLEFSDKGVWQRTPGAAENTLPP